MTRTLALDPGTKCGWAIRCKDGSVDHGTWNLSERSGEGGGMRFVRLLRHLNSLHLEKGPIERICYEEIKSFMVPMAKGSRRESMAFAAAYGGVKSHIMSWAEERSIPYESVSPGTIKKFATGSGVASKDQMMYAAARKLQLCPVDDNAADAIWLLFYTEALDRGDLLPQTKTRARRKRRRKGSTQGQEGGV